MKGKSLHSETGPKMTVTLSPIVPYALQQCLGRAHRKQTAVHVMTTEERLIERLKEKLARLDKLENFDTLKP